MKPRDEIKKLTDRLHELATGLADENAQMEREIMQFILGDDFIHMAKSWKVPIEALGLSNRALNCLKPRDIKTIGQLARLDRDTIKNFRNLGPHVFNEINEKIKHFGFKGWDMEVVK